MTKAKLRAIQSKFDKVIHLIRFYEKNGRGLLVAALFYPEAYSLGELLGKSERQVLRRIKKGRPKLAKMTLARRRIVQEKIRLSSGFRSPDFISDFEPKNSHHLMQGRKPIDPSTLYKKD